jgi:hypothetical protein
MTLAHETINRRVARIHGRWTQYEILRRISDDRELRHHDQVSSAGRGAVARPSDARQVAVDIAYCGVELREGNGELHCELAVPGSILAGPPQFSMQ